MKVYWAYEDRQREHAGAIPPERLNLPSATLPADSPFRGEQQYTQVWRAIEAGYRVSPGDCGPVRVLSRFGFAVRCPGRVLVRRSEERRRFREYESTLTRFGYAELGGDPWPGTDSGFVASWIAGAEFFKIHTGIVVYFPADHYLYQGPLPNQALTDAPVVMAGLEYAVPKRTKLIGGQEFGVASLNVILPLPGAGAEVVVERGELLAWFYPVPKDTGDLETFSESP